MRSIEAEGNTIDDAIANALETLQVERDRVEIEILSDATRGLFGLGAKKARVRATLRAPVWDKREDPQDEQPRSIPAERQSPERQPQRARAAASPRPSRPAPVEEPPPSVGDEPGEVGPAMEARPISREAAECGVGFLRQTLELMEIQATVEPQYGATPDDVVLQIEGDASGIVIGRHGQALDAIEYVVNRRVAREFPGVGHIVVDAASYRARRRDSLTDMALRMADKAKREQRTVTLNPLSPRDRRVVHMALRDDRAVSTRSQGTGLHRKLLIIPSAGRRQGGGRPAGGPSRNY
jgi:spoIIIJ-associated protein